MNASNLPTLTTPGVIARELGVPLHRVLYILSTRHHIQPTEFAGRLRVYDRHAVAMVRHELNAIDARRCREPKQTSVDFLPQKCRVVTGHPRDSSSGMAKRKRPLAANKRESTLLVVFIPSRDRDEQPIEQERWVTAALEFLGRQFGGATAFPQGRGVWRDDRRGGRLVFDEPVIINCYTDEASLESAADELRAFLVAMGTQTAQGAVGLVIDRDYLEIEL